METPAIIKPEWVPSAYTGNSTADAPPDAPAHTRPPAAPPLAQKHRRKSSTPKKRR